MATIKVVKGDIFEQDVDAIVNPANTHMAHGGGLAGVIAARAGRQLVRESKRKAPVGTGRAIITSAGRLPFKAVIHAVGPIWGSQSQRQSETLLWWAHMSAMRTADQHGLKSVAFPAISCGIFHFPVELAAPQAVAAVREAMESGGVERVVFVLPEKREYRAFRRAVKGRWWRFWR